MIRILAAVAVVWLALLPPLFTDGACTAEFDKVVALLDENRKSFASPTAAQDYWTSRQLPVSVLSVDDCRRVKPRFLARCGSGTLVYVEVPVKNRICRIYRDSDIRVQLQYDDHNRLARMVTDMNPFKSLPLSWLGVTLHWAR